jgi:rhodanese-related sulfurtransferase
MDRPGAFSISANTVYDRLGTSTGALLLDVREPADRRLGSPAAGRCAPLARPTAARPVIVLYCQDGTGNSPKLTQWLIEGGVEAFFLEGGIDEWRRERFATRRRTGQAPTQWVTRERPKVDRIACPWLIRRFIDPEAIFYYMPPANVRGFAAWSGAVPYDVDGAEFGHHGDHCSFDAFLALFQIKDPALDRLAAVVRGADTGKLELTPQSPGLLALSHGLGMTIGDDMVQLEHGMVIYDALYAWCRAQAGTPLTAAAGRKA